MIMHLVRCSILCIAIAGVVACGDDDKPGKDGDAIGDAEVSDSDAIEETTPDTRDDATEETADVADTGDSVQPDGETIDDVTPDGSDGEVATGTYQAVHVWSPDGASVTARFNAEIDPASAKAAGTLKLVASDGAIANVTDILVIQGNDVQLSVDPILASTKTWDLEVAGLRSTDGRRLTWSGPVKATLFLNMVWHQHQPSYLDPTKDELQGPWVRKHAQKDYYDMTAMLVAFPKVHLNVNLTSSLLTQLERYVDALGPYVNVAQGTVDEPGFLGAHEGHTDPWVDLLLKDTPVPAALTEPERDRYYAGVWSFKSISEVLRSFFPEYEALLARDAATYTKYDLALLKVWFEVAWMDPSFFHATTIEMKDGPVAIDLSDVVTEEGGRYRLNAKYTDTTIAEATRIADLEKLANRMVAEEYKIMAGVFVIHQKMMANASPAPQVEVLTTPFFHPILPLLFNTDLAKVGQPADPLPEPAFAYPEDAALQIAMAVEYYTGVFGRAPRGMWPSEGAVAEEIVPALAANGIEWIATDRQVLDRGLPGASHLRPYMIDGDTVVGNGGSDADDLMIVFRDTEISDKVGFFYQSQPPGENIADFMLSVIGKAGNYGEPQRLLSVILDGENAWEWYSKDHDAKQFLEGLYTSLTQAYNAGAVITVTGGEYIDGNAGRNVPAHPVTAMTEYENLIPGSWIGGRLDTWIGEPEENLAWVYLKTARDEMEAAKAQLEPILGMPESYLVPPVEGGTKLAWWRAWRNVLSAEGSDWFWWYGSDQTAAGGDDSPFDDIFRAQLIAAYTELNTALTGEGFEAVPVPAFSPILQPAPIVMTGPFGTLPVLDGLLTPDQSEWVPPGGVFFDGDSSGATADPNDDIARVFYGFNRLQSGRIFLGIDLREDLSAKLGTDYQLVIYTSQGHLVGGELVQDPTAATAEGVAASFQSGGAARRIAINFLGLVPVAKLQKATAAGGWEDAPATLNLGGPVVGGTLLELQFLMSDLGMTNGDPLEILLVAVEGGEVRDIAPNVGTQIVFADPTRLVTVAFELDVTGDLVAAISDPPPPDGTGVPSIVGNQDVFGQWSPNTVPMKDDGVAPDLVANDGIWTFGHTFVPGTGLQYKYTIGHAGESWGGTEEYPLTNRGYTVPADGTKRVRVRDIFADRPDPSGTRAPNTIVTIEE